MKQITTLIFVTFLSCCQSFVLESKSAFRINKNINDSLVRPLSATTESSLLAGKSLIVVSPPGGVGEVVAVEAAKRGTLVKWFVVSSLRAASPTPSLISFSQSLLETIREAGGNVELAGADAKALLEEEDTLAAVNTWCGQQQALVCTLDGIDVKRLEFNEPEDFEEDENEDAELIWKNAIRLTAKQASLGVTGQKIAIFSVAEGEDVASDMKSESSNPLASIVDGNEVTSTVSNKVNQFLGIKRMPKPPSSLVEALGENAYKLRHGELFGLPESSQRFSPMLSGPELVPRLCEEYEMRSVRVDPTLSVSGNSMLDPNARTCRHAVGTAAALMLSDDIIDETNNDDSLDIFVTSLASRDGFTLEAWKAEFKRVQEKLTRGQAAQLFSADFSSVPDLDRLSTWIATKWAPKVLKTYDIAAIRFGARPVYANKVAPDTVEIVWQKLVEFETIIVGKMIIKVSDSGIVATRAGGDSASGFGAISTKPLPGENAIVQTLSQAAAQAIETGLAKKPQRILKIPVDAPAIIPPTTKDAAEEELRPTRRQARAAYAGSGPRQKGSKRSSVRQRGSRKKTTTDGGDNDETTEQQQQQE